MPIDFTKPAVTGNYATGVLQPTNDAIKALSQLLDPDFAGTMTGIPTGAKGLRSGLIHEFNGTSWVEKTVGYAKKSGDTFTGTVKASVAEGFRIVNDSAFLSFYNTAESSRSGYIQAASNNVFQFAAEGSTQFAWSLSGAQKMSLSQTGLNLTTGLAEGVADFTATKVGSYGKIGVLKSGIGGWYISAGTVTPNAFELSFNAQPPVLTIDGSSAVFPNTINTGFGGTPTYPVDILRSGNQVFFRARQTTTGASVLIGTDTSTAYILGNNAPLGLYTQDTERVKIDTVGRVSINAPSGGVALSVAGLLGATTATFSDTANPKIALFTSAERAFWQYTESTAIMRIDSDAQLDLASNNTVRLSINSLGNTSIAAPSSGVTLSLGSISGGIAQRWSDGTIDGQVSFGSSGLFFGTVTNHPTYLGSNSQTRINIGSAGNILVNAPTSGTLMTLNGLTASNTLAVNSTGAASSLALGWAAGIAAGKWNLYTSATDPIVIGTQGSGTTSLATNNVERLIVDSIGAIGIGMTPVASGNNRALLQLVPRTGLEADSGIFLGNFSNPASNVLDYYQEGTFTPSLLFGSGQTGMSATCTGRFTRVGNLVHYWITILLTAKGTSTGQATINILPWNSLNNPSPSGVGGTYVNMAGITGPIIARATANLLTLAIGGTTGVTGMTEANFTNTSYLEIFGSHTVI